MKTNIFLPKKVIHQKSLFFRYVLKQGFLVMIGCLILMQGKSQADKRIIMADKYFAAGEYFTAAGLYGQFLHSFDKLGNQSGFPLNVRRSGAGGTGNYKSKTDILFKQAESYRLANYWEEAAALYKECLEKDPSKYAAAYYWLAVCQRSLGDYSAAEESLKNYFKDNNAANEWYNAALQEKQTLQFVKEQLARPDSVMYHTQKIKTEFGDHGVFAPVAISQNELLFTSTKADSVAVGTNPYHNRLFRSSLTNNDIKDRQPVAIESIDSSLNQGAASISPDNNHLYLTQWRKENGQTISSIYHSVRTINGWSKPELLNSVNEPGHNSKQPFLSADGKYLLFSSDRTGGKGGFDIWYAPLLADGTTGEPINASAINSSANEQAPFYHSASGTLVFSSDRTPGMGGYDLFSANGSITDWKAPENMGAPVNSSRDDIYFFANEKSGLLDNAIISSDRGSECCLAIYAITKTARKRVISGVVMDCAINEPLDSAKVILKDAAGKTWETITAKDGKYSFDLSGDASQHKLFVTREKYNDSLANISIQNIDETNWQTDTIRTAALCLEKKFVLKVENVVTLYFDFDKSDLKDRGTEQLDSIYNVMVENPTFRIQISGYTDSKGSVDYNNKLSERRAKACADYLIQKGLSPARISIYSFGALFPVEMEILNGRDNAEGRSKNRRALINIDKE